MASAGPCEALRRPPDRDPGPDRRSGGGAAGSRPGGGRRGPGVGRSQPASGSIRGGARGVLRGPAVAVMTYLEAIADGLREALRADPAVILLGEDVAAYGGACKLTKGFLEEWGP